MLSRRSLQARIVLAFILLIVVFLGVAAQRVIDGERNDAAAQAAREEIQATNDAARELHVAVLQRDALALQALGADVAGVRGRVLEDLEAASNLVARATDRLAGVPAAAVLPQDAGSPTPSSRASRVSSPARRRLLGRCRMH